MSKREELSRIIDERLALTTHTSFCTPRAERILDAILDALMEPGEGPMLAGNQQLCDAIQCNCGEEFIWQAVLTAIREGK